MKTEKKKQMKTVFIHRNDDGQTCTLDHFEIHIEKRWKILGLDIEKSHKGVTPRGRR